MSEARQTTVVPRAPHPDTLRDASRIILDDSGTRLLCWCPIHRCGAVYNIEVGIWAMQAPISFAEFVASLDSRGLTVDDGPDARRWITEGLTGDAMQPSAPGGRC